GTHQGGGVDRRQVGRHPRHRAHGGDQVLSIAAVKSDPGDLTGDAGKELAAATVVTMSAIAAVPADTYPLARLPARDAGSDRIDYPGHLMAWDPGISKSGISSFLDE